MPHIKTIEGQLQAQGLKFTIIATSDIFGAYSEIQNSMEIGRAHV